MNEHNQHGPDSGHVGSQLCRIQRAVALMEANFAAKLSREEMARAAGLSVSHFSKLFTQCMGLSPHQYLVLCRLRHAKKLLLTLEQGLSIVDVAAEAGFADQAHFSRHFRRTYGISPLAFRRTTRGEPETPRKFGDLKTGC
jgi:AraC family transcriptional regulator